MRKLLFCVPMMLLLAGCTPAKVSQAEELTLGLRGEYLEMTACSTHLSVSADYGQRVYSYEMDAALEEEELTLTLTAPETVAGMTARLDGETGTLEYDGVWVETGTLDDNGLTPLGAFSAMLEAARGGYITACALDEEENLLRVDCGDPTASPGKGREVTLWFEPSTRNLVRGEVSVDGFRVILCECTDFVKS
ncbi:hypothetical protein ACTQ4E_11310 [Lawsonibacter sp. LCP25S3_G6]|uniref:hypothetical protein n=1 Tax=unclassified Lawsonibacter TaxID=2617946 RepID=UPI003F96267F